jgi:hypothetical protein
MAKRLLIVDNDDLTETISEIEKLAKAKRISIECFPLLIGLPDGNEVIEDGKISIALVKEKLASEYGSLRFHMIASDFRLNDEHVDGVEILRQFGAITNTRKAKRILYSAELEEIVQEYLDGYKNQQKNFQDSWDSFRTLIKLEILDFTKRENVEQSIVDAIARISEQEDDFILEELLANKDLRFNSTIEIYEGLTFGEIADKICGNDSLSLNLKKKIIQMTISHLAHLENE